MVKLLKLKKMNRKLFFGLLVSACMLFATSCKKDELDESLWGEAKVTFSLGLEGENVATKSISDGKQADKLIYAVFDENGIRISSIEAVEKTGVTFPTTESITLAKGQTYKVAFWAQDNDCEAYTVNTSTMNVAVSYDNAPNNDETRDAFFKTVEFTVTGSTSIDVEMKRPFAQINVGVTKEDWDAAVASGIVIENSSVVIKNAATSLNLIDGTVGTETVVDVSYASNTIPNEPLNVDTDGDGIKEEYNWLSMSYILVADETDGASRATLQSLQYTFTPVNGNPIELEAGLNAVPVQRNWRTNILGKILTGDIDFNISIDPIYEDDYNIEPQEPWDGTADISWCSLDEDGKVVAPANGEAYLIKDAFDLAGLAKLVNEGNDFEGITVKLTEDVDLYALDENGEPISFTPIGNGKVNDDYVYFKGEFDGQDHTIKNMYQNGWALGYEWDVYGAVGLFGHAQDATFKNITIEGQETLVEGGDVAGVVAHAMGNCTFENITIKDSQVATYNNGCAGIVAWTEDGTYNFKDITIAADVVLAGLWGSFDSSIGGVVAQADTSATYNFENVIVNCRIDAYNDCTASYEYYNYRMCGMVIGRCEATTTIDGTNYPDLTKYNLTFNNVTVNYGDWMNYHYCDPTPGHNNGRGMRVEPGYAYDGLPADYDHSQCTTHHNLLIPFDQLIGGAQLGVKGLKTVEGITVTYPAPNN